MCGLTGFLVGDGAQIPVLRCAVFAGDRDEVADLAVRLTEADVNNQDALGRYAALAGLSPETFRDRFGTVR